MKRHPILTLILLTFMLIIPVHAQTYEDWMDTNIWTEQDGYDYLDIINATYIEVWSGRNVDMWLYFDLGTQVFIDWTHDIDVKVDWTFSTGRFYIFFVIANTINDVYDLTIADESFLYCWVYRDATGHRIGMREIHEGDAYTGSPYYYINTGQWYYLTISKSGTNFRQQIFTDSDRTTQVNDVNLTLHEDYTFRYLYSFDTYNSGHAYYIQGYSRNLNIGKYYVPYYHNEDGIFRVDNATMTNGTIREYDNSGNTTVELLGVPLNASYVFQNFTWDTGSSTSNPYNHTISYHDRVWCYFTSPTPTIGAIGYLGLLFGLFAIGIAVVVLAIHRLW